MLTARQTVETYFLEARHMLLEVAALLDRHDAAAARDEAPRTGTAAGDAAAREKLAILREALAVLASEPCDGERTARLLDLFARV
ncbi:MAG: hypothetical protein ACKOZU_00490 [Planctomycetaceae bacterium]